VWSAEGRKKVWERQADDIQPQVVSLQCLSVQAERSKTHKLSFFSFASKSREIIVRWE
jgi:hypothetical protein